MNVTKIILTRCKILHLKCTEGQGAHRLTALLQTPPSRIWGKGEGEGKRKGREVKSEVGQGREGRRR